MKYAIFFAAFVLALPVALADQVPFDYSVSYVDPVANRDFTGFGGATFDDVPVFFSGSDVNFQVTMTSERDFTDVMIVVLQEYYCATGSDTTCDSLLLEKMAGNFMTTKFYSKINKGETISFTGSFHPVDGFSSLDRTHLLVLNCPGGKCPDINEFLQDYNHHYYNANHLNKTVEQNLDWKYFKWGKVILDDPFAGIWCPR